jgi:hypothetical protein
VLLRAKDLLQGKVSFNDPKRSPKWAKVRDQHLQKNPKCEVCGSKKFLNVHHIKPFNKHPELELESSNLITLCEARKKGVNCHLWFGHLGNFKKINANVIIDCFTWKSKLSS